MDFFVKDPKNGRTTLVVKKLGPQYICIYELEKKKKNLRGFLLN